MASAIFIINQKGEQLVTRHFRSDVSNSSINSFRTQIIASKQTGQSAPVVLMEGTTFMYIRQKNLYLVAATRGNPNAALVFEFLMQKLRILKSYLGDDVDDEAVQGNFTLIYELLDEIMDYGYPQTTSVDVLRLYINLGQVVNNGPVAEGTALTSQITGAIDWRREGIRYRNNEVFIDVHETVSILTSTTGAVLRSEVQGKVMMRAFLSGMPECKFGLNDKLIMEKENPAAASGRPGKKVGVEIDDCTFHRCVRLGKFDSERTITFIPPDGEFELMRFRVNDVKQPFRLFPSVREDGKTKLSIDLKVLADFPYDKKATNVVIKFPVPNNTASTLIEVSKGRARFEPAEKAIVWRLSSFPGSTEINMSAEVNLIQLSRGDKGWVRPPVSMDFQIQMLSVSGVEVRFLKVYEKSSYTTSRWVSYLAKAGEYQIKI
jgi:AP-2 complex subunit mu-1